MTKEAKIEHAPIERCEFKDGDSLRIVVRRARTYACWLPDEPYPESEADGKLFTAAPELLAMLKNVLDEIEMHDHFIVGKALELIAKIEGKS